jgi:pyrroloquinoline quinone biosynthesis protein B
MRAPIFRVLLAIACLTAACAPGGDAVNAPALPPDSPRLLVLGTAQDGGIPHASCRCSHCAEAAADPERRRDVASVAILADGKRYLIDATPDLRRQLERLATATGDDSTGIDRSPVDGVFLTHAHIGHYTGLAFFGFEAVHTRGLPVYCSPSMAAFLRANGPWSQLVDMGNVELREVVPGVTIELPGGVRVEPIAVPHRDEFTDTLGFVIAGPTSRVLYVPDTDPWRVWGERLDAVLSGVDVALVDGAFFSPEELPDRDISKIRHPMMTTTMERLGPLVDEGRLRVVFTHLNHSNLALDPAGAPAQEVQRRGFRIAHDGEELPL